MTKMQKMTNKEAICNLENWKIFDKKIVEIDGDLGESIRLAIKALEREENLEQAVQPRTTEDNSAVGDLISRSELIKASCRIELTSDEAYNCTIGREKVLNLIQNAPTVEAYTNDDIQQAIKTGYSDGYGMAKAKFCPNCGADMRKEEEE